MAIIQCRKCPGQIGWPDESAKLEHHDDGSHTLYGRYDVPSSPISETGSS